jgi:hypothetical protein
MPEAKQGQAAAAAAATEAAAFAGNGGVVGEVDLGLLVDWTFACVAADCRSPRVCVPADNVCPPAAAAAAVKPCLLLLPQKWRQKTPSSRQALRRCPLLAMVGRRKPVRKRSSVPACRVAVCGCKHRERGSYRTQGLALVLGIHTRSDCTAMQ